MSELLCAYVCLFLRHLVKGMAGSLIDSADCYLYKTYHVVGPQSQIYHVNTLRFSPAKHMTSSPVTYRVVGPQSQLYHVHASRIFPANTT